MTSTPTYLWWDGRMMHWEDATVHVSALGTSTVSAVFEGIRAYWNPDQEELYVFRLAEHMQRFEESMKLVRLDQDYSTEALAQHLVELIAANRYSEDISIRPLGFRSISERVGFSSIGSDASIVIITSRSRSHLLTDMKKDACISSWTRISDNVLPPRVKNVSNYRNGQLARMEARDGGYDEPILLNNQWKVAEGASACIMMVRDNTLVTPAVTSGLLESITRHTILTLAREELGIPVQERDIDRTELYLAREVFLCGTAAEITPLVSVDRYRVGDGDIGPVTRQLQQLYHDLLRGVDERYADWRTPVYHTSAVSR